MSAVPPITPERLKDLIAKSNDCLGQICTLSVSNAPTGTIRALTRTEAFFTFNPLGRGLKGAWSIVPGTIDLVKEGALAVNDGVGATVYTGLNAATGSNIPYESSGALGQSIQQEGVLATTGKLVHGVVTNLPGIGLINGLYHRNPEIIGAGIVGALPLGVPLLKRGSVVTAGESVPRLPSGPTLSPRSQPPSTPIKSSGVAVEKPSQPKTIFSGHGGFEKGDGSLVVPEGTTVTTYSKFGGSITDRLGNAIETGQDVSGVPSRQFLPGESIPNYTLYPPEGLNILGSPTIVEAPTKLSDLLRPNMGECHWAACTHSPGTPSANLVFDTLGVIDSTTDKFVKIYKKP
jgi:hypothetical protein